jgi:transmembrane sensor
MSNSLNSYSGFNEEDFVCDPLFQDWVMMPTEEKESFWRSFLHQFPEKKETVDKARAVLSNISFIEHVPGDDRAQRSFERHLAVIQDTGTGKVVRMKPVGNRMIKILKVAALFGGVVLAVYLAVSLFSNKGGAEKMALQTEYGKQKQVLLPDSTAIVLNANSRIEYSKDWDKGKKREVWLEGEAFFDVRHLNRDTMQVVPFEQFVVHTKHMDVEVLGTSFNIRQRRGKTEIVLQTGRIKIKFKDNSSGDIVMSPGDIVTYDSASNDISRSTAVPENYTAWKEKKLILNNPEVNEIIAYLEDNFGKKIVLRNADLGERKIEGPILLNNLDDALFILSIVLKADVIHKDSSTVIIQPR